ncbi:MAG TPA: hypothetical protein VD816_00820 [Ohtaekwangia sp.]|nr:hypothetical protein [Ohtaekwangia sp.]
MEQQLINAFMKLVAKAGGGFLIRELIQQVDDNGNPKIWTPDEIRHAIDYVNLEIDTFGEPEAMMVIGALVKKYNLNPELLPQTVTSTASSPGSSAQEPAR